MTQHSPPLNYLKYSAQVPAFFIAVGQPFLTRGHNTMLVNQAVCRIQMELAAFIKSRGIGGSTLKARFGRSLQGRLAPPHVPRGEIHSLGHSAATELSKISFASIISLRRPTGAND
jgi:hypothetical protein